MNIKTAGILAAALWGAIAVLLVVIGLTARVYGCALPVPAVDRTARLFDACLHAPRAERRFCEAAYVDYAGTVQARTTCIQCHSKHHETE
jgi:hypothetical protein